MTGEAGTALVAAGRTSHSEIIRKTMMADWSPQAVALTVSRADAESALAVARQRTVALVEADPGLSGPGAINLINALADIGAKIAPTIPDEAAQRWRVAMLKALANLPAKVAVQATQRALHEPLRIDPRSKDGVVLFRPAQYLNEVETLIRQQAEVLLAQQRLALLRLQALIAEIERASAPLLAAPVVDEPISSAEIRALSPELRQMGLGQGWISQEQIDEALGQQSPPPDPAHGGLGGETDPRGDSSPDTDARP